jgi:hypothetical protein
MNAQDLLTQAEALPVEERAFLAESLMRSLGEPDPAVEAQWTKLARERLAELREGEVAPVRGDDAMKRLLSRTSG